MSDYKPEILPSGVLMRKIKAQDEDFILSNIDQALIVTNLDIAAMYGLAYPEKPIDAEQAWHHLSQKLTDGSKGKIEMTLGNRLKSERKLIKESLREVAKCIGTTHGYLSKIERDQIDHPSIWTIWRLCQHYKIRIDAVINERFAPKNGPANRNK